MALSLLGYRSSGWRDPSTAASSITRYKEIALSSKIPACSTSRGVLGRATDRPVSAVSDGSSSDEDYYDALGSPVMMAPRDIRIPASSKTVRVTPPPLENDVGEMGWQKSEPPKELFNVPHGTSSELETIVVGSVERVQQQLAEEQSLLENTSRAQEQELERAIRLAEEQSLSEHLARVRADELNRAMPTPSGTQGRRESSEVQVPRTLAPNDRHASRGSGSRGSDASINTTSSRDSGYASGLADTSAPKARIGSLFSFGNAFRRSRDRVDISGQASQRSGSISTTGTRECVSCLDDFNSRDLIPLTCHNYCKPCFQTLISTALASETQWPPKCCLNEIPTDTVLPHVTPRDKKRYKELLEERSVPAGERIYCYRTSCTAWIPPSNIQKSISCAVCLSCRRKTCTSCRGVHHASGECPQDQNLRATLRLANEEGWRRCYSCLAVVEHNQGCIHMTCTCKAQFCYICGLRWRTCACSDAQLQTVLQAANNRRAAAQAQEREAETEQQAAARAAEAEAAELADILQQIETFELEEAARMAREEEELRLALISDRQRQQEEHIIAVSKKYFDLRNELDFLQDLQKVALTERYEEEVEMQNMHANIRAAMFARHARELEVANSLSRNKISDSQFVISKECERRRAVQQVQEDLYGAQLQDYYKRRPNGEAAIAEAMQILQKRNNESYDLWAAQKAVQQEQLVAEARQEAELLRRNHEAQVVATEAKIREIKKKVQIGKVSDDKWFEVVVSVRARMLMEMEEQAYAFE